ncbi:MAG: hypothetical protein SNJ78_09340, partial [Spirochaetales bacterium]
TEVGYPTRGWYLSRVSERNKPAYVIKTLAGLLTRGARVVFWYELFDKFPQGKAPSRWDSELYFGLQYPDFKPKSGAAAYALMAKHTAGSIYRADLVQVSSKPDDLEVLPFVHPERGVTLILINRLTQPGEELRVKLTPIENLYVHDIATGKKTRVSSEGVFFLSDQPLFVTWENPIPTSVLPTLRVETVQSPSSSVTFSGELSFTFSF